MEMKETCERWNALFDFSHLANRHHDFLGIPLDVL
jgi:hypothetical protein